MSRLATAARLARTVRHLRWRQLAYRVRRLLPARMAAAGHGWHHERAREALTALGALGPVGTPDETRRVATAWLNRRAVWLGAIREWDGDWTTTGPSPLWRYHLHYHEHLADLAWLAADTSDPDVRRTAVALLERDVSDWMHQCPRDARPAWDPYPVSVRIGAWMRILAFSGAWLAPRVRESMQLAMSVHVAHLAQHREWHLDGNHLLRNDWALLLGHALLRPDGRTAADTRDLLAAHGRFARAMRAQFLDDGWHEERSPMYHARALRDAVDAREVCAAIGMPLPPDVEARMTSAAHALLWMHRTDGALWALNDTAAEHGVDVSGLLASMLPDGSPPLHGVRHFTDAQVVVACDADSGDRLRVDLGAPAPAHQPGHAHAGALALEYDTAGVPCLIDAGCSGYDGDPWRPYLRSTRSHNTVQTDGRDQSEMWATFRIGGRARTEVRQVSGTPDHLDIIARCRPWYDPTVLHERHVRRETRSLVVQDTILHAREARLHWHLHPGWHAARVSDNRVELSRGTTRLVLSVDGADTLTLHHGDAHAPLGWYAQGFGQVRPTWTIAAVSKTTPGMHFTTRLVHTD